jgi:diphosphoinositol-polyphosphate diphosphatase
MNLCIYVQVPVEEAYGLCRYDWMREALDKLKEQLLFESSFRPLPSPELVDPSSLYMVMPTVAEGAVALC